MRGGEYVRVPAQDLHGVLAVELVEPDGQERTQAVSAEEFHEPSQPGLAADVCGYPPGLVQADAADLRELFGLAL